jgi:hypothetical protein
MCRLECSANAGPAGASATTSPSVVAATKEDMRMMNSLLRDLPATAGCGEISSLIDAEEDLRSRSNEVE